jgi:hypothetical protein
MVPHPDLVPHLDPVRHPHPDVEPDPDVEQDPVQLPVPHPNPVPHPDSVPHPVPHTVSVIDTADHKKIDFKVKYLHKYKVILKKALNQCCGAASFLCGSGSVSGSG